VTAAGARPAQQREAAMPRVDRFPKDETTPSALLHYGCSAMARREQERTGRELE